MGNQDHGIGGIQTDTGHIEFRHNPAWYHAPVCRVFNLVTEANHAADKIRSEDKLFLTNHSRQAATEQLDEFGRALGLLMEGIALHIVRAPGLDPEAMRAQIREVDDEFIGCPNGANAMNAARGANQAMQKYNKAVERQLKGLGDEVRALTTLFTTTLLRLSPMSEKAVIDIQAAHRKVADSARFEDFHLIRTQFEEALRQLEGEHARCNATQSGLLAPGQQEDEVTGLPGRVAAEEYLSQVSKECTNVYMACFVVERVDMFTSDMAIPSGTRFCSCSRSW